MLIPLIGLISKYGKCPLFSCRAVFGVYLY